MMYTFIDAPPGGATNYSFDGERLFILSDRIGDIYNSAYLEISPNEL